MNLLRKWYEAADSTVLLSLPRMGLSLSHSLDTIVSDWNLVASGLSLGLFWKLGGEKMIGKIVILGLLAVSAIYGITTMTHSTPKPISQEPSCTFLLYGEICSNVPQGGGGPGGVHGVSLM